MNKLERINYPLKQQPNGDYLWLNLFRINSHNPGPHVHIQANVHGAELQGNAVILELLKWFQENPFRGSVTFIPFANPAGVNQKSGMYTHGRYNPVTGNNWNRNYVDFMSLPAEKTGFDLKSFVENNIDKSDSDIRDMFKGEIFKMCDHFDAYRSKRGGANEDGNFNLLLQKVASTSDIVLDLHTGPIATRYLYSAEYQRESASHLMFPHVLLIPNEFAGAMDEATFVPWFELTEEFKKKGREFKTHFEAYTLELGSEERISFSEAKLDAKRILNYLAYKGMHDIELTDLPNSKSKYCLLEDYKSYYAPKGGVYEFLLAPGDEFNEGDVLAKSLSFKEVKNELSLDKATADVVAIAAGIIINHNTSSSVAQGQTLYQVMENIKEL